jgi:SAM-dependent methyltransferase
MRTLELIRDYFRGDKGNTPSPAQSAAPAQAPAPLISLSYADRVRNETEAYAADIDVHMLPAIFHYWSHTYVRPELEAFGYQYPEHFFETELAHVMRQNPKKRHRFASLGSGNGDTEVLIAQRLLMQGFSEFCIDCLELTPEMNARTAVLARDSHVESHIQAISADLNHWQPEHSYSAVMANQSLHHMVELERIFDLVKSALTSEGRFLVYDMIGRNGHQRWPEALAIVREFWSELPEHYRYNVQLKRDEQEFLDWDCSVEGFEGIRSQDILPLLCERFHFELFLPFANVIDPFVDRGFGHNFNAEAEWDRDFIDRVHARDVLELSKGTITPTHLIAVLTKSAPSALRWRAGFNPKNCIRR